MAVGGGGVPAFPAYMLAKAVLTGFRLAGQSGLRMPVTLRDRIYAYVFAERPAPCRIAGLAFAGVCDVASGWTGLDAVYAYYERVRVSAQGVPARLVFGPNTVLAGFLSEFDFQLDDAAAGVGSFAFGFQAVPRNVEFGFPRPLPWEALDTDLVTR